MRKYQRLVGSDLETEVDEDLENPDPAQDMLGSFQDLRVPPANRLERLKGERSGEHSIRINDQWRVCFRWNGGPKVQEMMESITGLKITDVLIEGAPPEIIVCLSNGLRFRSMSAVSGDPQWSIRIQSGEYLSCEDGELVSRPGDEARGLSQEENELIEWASETAKRWGTPIAEPAGGCCNACRNFERIDGNYSLLDYGVCSLEGGPFDGRVVNVGSGCPEFMNG